MKLDADYLRKITLDGAVKRYGEDLSEEILERIDFELNVVKDMGYPGLSDRQDLSMKPVKWVCQSDRTWFSCGISGCLLLENYGY